MTVVEACSHVRSGHPVARELPIHPELRVELCAMCLIRLRNECKRPL